MSKEEVFKVLGAHFDSKGKSFHPKCNYDPETRSERCLEFVPPMTYGNMNVGWLGYGIGAKGLDYMTMEFTAAGCIDKRFWEKHPLNQFDTLSTLMQQHYGYPDVVKIGEVGWSDNQGQGRILHLALRPSEPDAPVKNCGRVVLTYITNERAMVSSKVERARNAQQNDL